MSGSSKKIQNKNVHTDTEGSKIMRFTKEAGEMGGECKSCPMLPYLYTQSKIIIMQVFVKF